MIRWATLVVSISPARIRLLILILAPTIAKCCWSLTVPWMIDVVCPARGKGSAATPTQRNNKKIIQVGVVPPRFDARETTRVPGPKLVGNDIGYF